MNPASIAIGIVLLLFIVIWFWPQKYYRPRLEPGETLVKEASATQFSDGVERSGRLCLTSTRLVFGYDAADPKGRGVRTDWDSRIPTFEENQWELKSIAKVESFPKAEVTFVASSTPLERVKIKCRDGSEFTLAVKTRSSKAEWASLIEISRQTGGQILTGFRIR